MEIQKAELEEQYFFTSLERIFIEKRIYKEEGYEQAPNKDKLIVFVDQALEPYKAKLVREVRKEDIEKLFEIRMIRITKFDSKKADELMRDLKKKIEQTKHDLAHLTEYTIQWFEHLKEKYGDKYPRRTEVRNFAAINVKTVVEANEKLYINRADGFIGTGLKKDEYLFDCSDIDDIIIFYKDGKYKIVKVADKLFVGSNILHIDIFKKADERTIYNVVYRDGKGGIYFWKRFFVTGISRDKEYDLTAGKAGSRVVYFSANKNGEAEKVRVLLKPAPHVKKPDFTMDFSELAIKSRSARGNVFSKYDIKSVTLRSKGGSTLGGRQVWFDPDILRINYDGQGMYLGEFQSEDQVLVVMKNGDFFLTSFDLTAHFEDNIRIIEKYDPEKVWSLLLWDADQKYFYGKRFQMNASIKVQNMLGDNPNSRIELLSDRSEACFRVVFTDEAREPLTLLMEEFIAVKGVTARGKRVTTFDVKQLEDITPEPEVPEEEPIDENPSAEPLESAESTPENAIPSEAPADTSEAAAAATAETIDDGVAFTIEATMPDDSKPLASEPDGQMSLF